jgi:hypothetical protein
MRNTLLISFIVLLFPLSASGDSNDFNQNIGGRWSTPQGGTMIISQCRGCDIITVTYRSSDIPVGSLTFKTDLYGIDNTTFRLAGRSQDEAFRAKDGWICTMRGLTLSVRGKLLGKWPTREIEASTCFASGSIGCEKGDKLNTKFFRSECDGTWK